MRTADRYYGSPGKPLTKVFLQLTEPPRDQPRRLDRLHEFGRDSQSEQLCSSDGVLDWQMNLRCQEDMFHLSGHHDWQVD